MACLVSSTKTAGLQSVGYHDIHEPHWSAHETIWALVVYEPMWPPVTYEPMWPLITMAFESIWCTGDQADKTDCQWDQIWQPQV